jgi:hypothetical protein
MYASQAASRVKDLGLHSAVCWHPSELLGWRNRSAVRISSRRTVCATDIYNTTGSATLRAICGRIEVSSGEEE